nr:hypothetical protein CFP56_04400 [Quercus suber]
MMRWEIPHPATVRSAGDLAMSWHSALQVTRKRQTWTFDVVRHMRLIGDIRSPANNSRHRKSVRLCCKGKIECFVIPIAMGRAAMVREDVFGIINHAVGMSLRSKSAFATTNKGFVVGSPWARTVPASSKGTGQSESRPASVQSWVWVLLSAVEGRCYDPDELQPLGLEIEHTEAIVSEITGGEQKDRQWTAENRVVSSSDLVAMSPCAFVLRAL